ncbi:DASH complex subunit ask1 [Coemansia sp. BCRC 34301]|nr:DASH complex subunit ask1 [Coemansia sp. BCRC 34301]
MLRPDSRASQSTGGRFTHALGAAIKREEYSRPPLPPTAGSHQPESQLEEVEQKITLALQAIDANFDHCQRTMARDVMPKVERLAKLSSELLQASQPWLQFFMAVAAADEDEDEQAREEVVAARDLDDDEETRQDPLGVAQRAAIEEQMHKGDITARFPGEAEGMGRRQLEAWNNAGGMEDEDEPVDIDTEIATPQLTSRYMTQELGFASVADVKPQVPGIAPTTPRVRNLKRSADIFSVSAKKRKLGTPAKATQQNGPAVPSTPLSMMRALVHAKGRVGGVGFRNIPGSGASHASKNSSSMGTDDLMPDTSPPHTTTFTLPRSRRIAPAHSVSKGKASVYGFGEEDDDDELVCEIDSLIRRYDSPRPPPSVAGSSLMGSSHGVASVARSEVPSSSGDMSELVNKYASPTVAVKVEEAVRIQGLVADMEEMLGEVEAMAHDAKEEADDDLETTGRVFTAAQAEDVAEEVDDFDDMPSPPHISSDINGAGVVVADILARVPVATEAPAAVAAATAAVRGVNPARRTFGGSGIMCNIPRMSIEAMDNEDMTVGHLSPLGNRGRMAAGMRPLQPVAEPLFHALGSSNDEDDPFAPTPERRRPTAVSRSSRYDAPVSAQSERTTGQVNFDVPQSTRSWSGGGLVTLGSEPTATYDSARLHLNAVLGDQDTTDSSARFNAEEEFDGTTTILPTREMLQHAAAQAAESESMAPQDHDDTRNSVVGSPGSECSESAPLEQDFDLELFPLAFQAPPAAFLLRALYDLIRSQDQRIWTLDDIVAELAAPSIPEELRSAGVAQLVVLLDLLARKRLVRGVADGLWSAH